MSISQIGPQHSSEKHPEPHGVYTHRDTRISALTADQLIAALSTLTPDQRALPVVAASECGGRGLVSGVQISEEEDWFTNYEIGDVPTNRLMLVLENAADA